MHNMSKCSRGVKSEQPESGCKRGRARSSRLHTGSQVMSGNAVKSIAPAAEYVAAGTSWEETGALSWKENILLLKTQSALQHERLPLIRWDCWIVCVQSISRVFMRAVNSRATRSHQQVRKKGQQIHLGSLYSQGPPSLTHWFPCVCICILQQRAEQIFNLDRSSSLSVMTACRKCHKLMEKKKNKQWTMANRWSHVFSISFGESSLSLCGNRSERI